jgi:hypothetical protein
MPRRLQKHWMGFVDRFSHLRTGVPPDDPVALMKPNRTYALQRKSAN